MTTSNVLYQATASAHGGRAGHIDSQDQQLNVRLSVPQAMGGKGGVGTNPEQLFAGALAASFESAMGTVARAESYEEFGVMQVMATVGLLADGDAHNLTVALDITLPGLSREQAQHLVVRGAEICAYTRALQGQTEIDYRLHDAE